MTDTSPPAINARSLRADYRHAQGAQSRLELLFAAGRALREAGPSAGVPDQILQQAMRFACAENGAILSNGQGLITVIVSRGRALPAGAQLSGTIACADAVRVSMPGEKQHMRARLLIGRDDAPGMEILVPLTARGLPQHVLALMSDGPHGVPHADDLRTLRTLASMLAPVMALMVRPAETSLRKSPDPDLHCLTPREHQVFALLPRGMTNAQMAAQLGIAAGTVKVHVEHILHKLHLSDRTSAAVQATRYGYGP